MAALEARIAELEEKAFPTIDESMSYEDYVKGLELTEAEKTELAAAYKSQKPSPLETN